MLFVSIFLLLATLGDQIAAVVGDDIILESEVTDNAAYLASDPTIQSMFQTDEDIRSYVLNELIARKLMVAQAEVESITVSNEVLQSQVDAIIENLKQNFPSEADFFKWLQERNATLDDIRENAMESQRTTMLMENLIMKKWGTKILISPIAVRRFYDENKDSIGIMPGKVKLAHILLAITPTEDKLKKAFERAVEIYKLILAGGEFNVIAQEFSEDENSRNRGGMLGKLKKGEAFEGFDNVVFSLKPGVVSQPFPTRLGYHIVEILNKGPDWVLARQILIKVETTKSDTTRTQNTANKIRDLIEQGVDFDSLAKQYTNASEVDLGEWVPKYLNPPYGAIVQDLKQGHASEPILTPVGYQVLYARERTPDRILPFEELRDKIHSFLYKQELQKYYTQLIDELKLKTFVKIFPSPERI